MTESPVKMESEVAPRPKAGYKSWKKKYRKMRITFEHKMHDGEDIFKQEARAQATVKRLAIENDRLLDILLEVNNSSEIPNERRINLSLPASKSSSTSAKYDTTLPIDKDHESRKDLPLKKFEDLLHDVPHQPYKVAKESDADLVAELAKSDADTYPAHFLTADDIDNYLHDIDLRIDPEAPITTLAPVAHPTSNPPLHPLLKNPNSATSWLRRHAPHIFLQGPIDGAGDGHDDATVDDGASHTPREHTGGRKSRGGARGERGGKSGSGRTSNAKGTKRGRASLAAAPDIDASMDDDGERGGASTPVPTKGKRKRVTEDDQGYRPKGGSASRPSKKKRKSEGAEGTPSVRKSKSKETIVAAAPDAE